MINSESLFQFEPSSGEGHLLRWTVPAGLPYCDGHFPQNPVLPAVAVLDGTLLALQLLTGDKTISFAKIHSGKFLNIITPGTALQIRLVRIKEQEWEAEWGSPDTEKIFARLKFSLRSGGS